MKAFETQTWTRKSVVVGILMLFMIGNGVISARTEKPGAILVVQKKDGQTIKGELLAVKNAMLTLLIYENATKVDVHLNELRSLRIEKKGAFLKGLGIGVLSGAATGALLGFLSGDDKSKGNWDILLFSAGQKALIFGIGLGFVGGAVGGIAGALKGADESITLDGMSPEKLGRVEAKLAFRARYRSVPIAEPRRASLKEPERTPPQVLELPALVSSSAATKRPSASPPNRRISRLHISLIPGIFDSQGAEKLSDVIDGAGFEIDEAYGPGFFSGRIAYGIGSLSPIHSSRGLC